MSAVMTIAGLVMKEIFRKRDFYVALVLTGVILGYAERLQFYQVNNISRYLMEMGLTLIFLFSVILTSALAARQFPSEIQNRTGPLLLAKPVTRMQFVLGKYLGSFFAGASAFGIFYAIFTGVVWMKAGQISWELAFQAFYLFLLNLMVLSAMVSAFSYGMTVGANVTVSLTMYLLINTYGAHFKESAASFPAFSKLICSAAYFLWPHFEFFDLRHRFIHDWPALPWTLMGVITLYALAYTSAFLLWAVVSLNKKSL